MLRVLALLLAAPAVATGAAGLTETQCLSRAATGCVAARAIARPTGFGSSHDGRTVVVRSGVGSLGSLGVFARDPRTGRLAQLAGRGGCVVRNARACTPGRGLETPAAVAFAPGDRDVYVAAANGQTVALYRRSRAGALALAGSWRGVVQPHDVAVAADGRTVYVAATRLAVFARNPATGRLAPRGSAAFAARSLALAPDGKTLYAAGADALVAFRRDPATGALTELQRVASTAEPALREPVALLVPRDGRDLYVASAGSAGIAEFRRDPATGGLAFARCATQSGAAGCGKANGLVGVGSLAADPAGTRVYAAASNARRGGLTVFGRDRATGKLSQLGRIRSARGLDRPNGVAVTPDGRELVVSSAAGIAVFRRTR